MNIFIEHAVCAIADIVVKVLTVLFKLFVVQKEQHGSLK